MKRQEKNGIIFDENEYSTDSSKEYFVAIEHYNEYIGIVYHEEYRHWNWIAELFFQHDTEEKITVGFKTRQEAAEHLRDLHQMRFAGIPMFIK